MKLPFINIKSYLTNWYRIFWKYDTIDVGFIRVLSPNLETDVFQVSTSLVHIY
jgi:hypothetical protein